MENYLKINIFVLFCVGFFLFFAYQQAEINQLEKRLNNAFEYYIDLRAEMRDVKVILEIK